MQDINASVNFDQRLYRQDIAGSRAHANVLAARLRVARHSLYDGTASGDLKGGARREPGLPRPSEMK